MYLGFSLSLPTLMLIKEHLLNQEKGEVEYFLHSQVNRLLFSLTGISINIKEIVYANV